MYNPNFVERDKLSTGYSWLLQVLKKMFSKASLYTHKVYQKMFKGIHLNEDQCMMSHDVKTLFTSVPITPATKIIKKLLEQDQELQPRSSLSIENTLSLLEFCLNSTYFSFQGKYFAQLEGAAMGSPLSPNVANLYMALK